MFVGMQAGAHHALCFAPAGRPVRQLPGWIACGVAMAAASPVEAGSPPTVDASEVGVQREAVFPEDGASNENPAWLMHRGGWQSPAYATRFDVFHDDELIHDTRPGLEREFDLLERLDGFTFIQDFGDPRALAREAASRGETFALVNTVAPLAMRQEGVAGVDEMARHLKERLEIMRERPNHLRYEGKLVFFLFNISSLETPGKWKEVLRRVRASAPDESILFILQRSVFKTSPAYFRAYGKVFDGLIIWAGPFERKLRQYRQYRAAMEELGREPIVYWGASNGYWRAEKGWLQDPRGTRTLRRNLNRALSKDFAGIMIESWNDFEEHTFVLPSREHHTVFFDVLDYYAARSAGNDWSADRPGLYFSAEQQVLPGDTLAMELLALPVAAEGERTARLRLRDRQGRVLYESRPMTFAPGAAEAVRFEAPTREWAGERLLIPEIVCNGEVYPTATWIRVAASLETDPWWRYVTLAKTLPMDDFSFRVGEAGPGETVAPGADSREVRIASRGKRSEGLFRLDAYRDGAPMLGGDYHRRVWGAVPEKKRFSVRLEFRMPKRYPGETQNRSGELRLPEGAGRWVAAHDRAGRDAVASDRRVSWNAGGDRKALVYAAAQLSDRSAPIRLSLPEAGFATRFTAEELAREGMLHFQVTPHSELRIHRNERPLGFPERFGKLGGRLTQRVGSRGGGHDPSRYLLAVGDGMKLGRTVPVLEAARGEAERHWFWDARANERFGAEMPASRISAPAWAFDAGDGLIADARPGRKRFQIALGGAFHRAGGFDPAAVPEWRSNEGNGALAFDGSDQAVLQANAFPRGAFVLDMRARLRQSEKRRFLLFCEDRFDLTCSPEGALRLRIRGRDGAPRVVSEDASVRWDEWTNIRVEYDYQTVKIRVDGALAGEVALSGRWDDPAAPLILGREGLGGDPSEATGGMRGELDRLRIQFGAPAEKTGEQTPQRTREES